MVVRRFDVFLITLDPTVGSEIRKTRPCVVLSPDDLNRYVATVIIAPMGTRGGRYPWRVPCEFEGRRGQVVLDQLRTVDKSRLVRHLGVLDAAEQKEVLDVLGRMFAE